jgi:hypothetical protein
MSVPPVRKAMRRLVLPAIGVCLLSVGLRVREARQMPAGAWYGTENECVAVSLASGKGFCDAYGPGSGPTAHVSPVHSLLLAGIYRLFGTYTTASGRLAQACVSICLACAVPLLLPLVGHKLGLPPASGWCAALLAAWLPAHRWNEITGSHDQVVGALALLLMVWVLADLSQNSWAGRRVLVRGGLLAGAALLIAPNLALVPAFYAFVTVVRQRDERVRILRAGVVLAAMVAVVLAPWIIRNCMVFHRFIPLRSNLGLELAVGNNSLATGHTYSPAFSTVHPYGNPAEQARLLQVGEPAYMQRKGREALAWIGNHPARFAYLTVRRAMLFWFTTDETWYRGGLKLRLNVRIYGLMGVAVILELVRLLWKRDPAGLLLACTTLGAATPYFITHVETRYRLPIVGLFALLSCNLLVASVSALRRRPQQEIPEPVVAADYYSRAA